MYLTAIEFLGRLITSSKFIDFRSWIETKKEPYNTEKKNLTINRADDEELIKSYFDVYKGLHGVKTCFYRLILEEIRKRPKVFA